MNAPLGTVQLFLRTSFGFRHPAQWVTAAQRTVFFVLAAMAEWLAQTRLFGWLMAGIASLAAMLLNLITPQATVELDDEPPRDRLKVLVLATIFAGIVISLGGNAIFTWLAGTMTGSDPRRYYYGEDVHNLVMYAAVAPAYLAASVSVLYCALTTLSLNGRTSASSATPAQPWRVLRLAFMLSSIVLVAGLVQVNYFQENILGLAKADPATLKAACRDRVFWFVDEVVATDGARRLVLNSAGVYYLCMQFCHMAVIAAALWFIITAMGALYRLGFRLTPDFLMQNGGTGPVTEKLRHFSLLEISAKWLALILTVHIYVWGDSCLRGGDNIRVTAMFLLALQFFILTTPRLLIEYRLLKCAADDARSSPASIDWPDVLDQRDKLKSVGVSSIHFVVQLALALLISKLIVFAIG